MGLFLVITLLTALMLFLRPTFLNRLFKKRFKLVNFLVISLVIAGLAWGILSLYTISARNGWLGDVTRENFLELTGVLRSSQKKIKSGRSKNMESKLFLFLF